MELKRIEMIGFKSFPEKIVVGFDKGITAIVGPNGSGKSNISDAIRWVLGEQSAKSLRGSRMEDVIFAGTERRKPVGYAMVTLVLDNSDHKIKLPYDEIAITRKVYRSGESEYLVNNTRYRLKDITEMLMDTGIGKDGYSVIGQGRIDQLLSTKPQERRMIFEEAAGIVKYKSRKEEAAKQLAEEAISLSRVNDRLHEMELRLGPLEKQAQVTAKYRELEGELKTYEINSFLDQYQQYHGAYTKSQEQLGLMEEQLVKAGQAQEETKKRAEEYTAKADEAGRKMTDLTQNIGEARLAREQAESSRKLNLQEQEHITQELNNGRIRLKDVKGRLSSRSSNISLEEKKIRQLKEAEKAGTQQYEEMEAQDRALSGDLMTLNQAFVTADRQLTELEQQRVEMTGRYEREKAQAELGENAGEEAKSRQEALIRSEEEQQELLEQTQEKIRSLREQTDTLSEKKQQQERSIEKIQDAIDDYRQRQEQIFQDLRAGQNRLTWLQDLEKDYEGFTNSVKVLMKLKDSDPGRYRGIRGTVSDVITVPTRLAIAMDTLLGQSVQNVIVEDQETAKQLIEILRSRHAGRATFQPLNVVTGRDHGRDEGQILNTQGVIGFADDLVKHDPEYHAIISRMLGNCVVVEDYDTGARLARKYNKYYRIVTLKGDIFNIGGSITGGSTGTNNKNGSILSRRGEQEEIRQQMKALREAAGAVQKEMSEKSREKEILQREYDAIVRSLAELNDQLQVQLQEENNRSFVLGQIRDQAEDIEREQESQMEEIRQRRQDVENLEKELEKQNEAIAEASLKVQSISADQSEKRTAKEGLREKMMEVQIQIAGIRQQRGSMEHTLEWEYDELEKLSQEADQLLENLSEWDEKMEALKNALAEILTDMEQKQGEIQEMEDSVQIMEANRTEAEQLREQGVRDMQEAIRIYNDLEKEKIRLENIYNRNKKELTNLQDTIWEKYELTYNAALKLRRDDLGSKTEIQKRISEIRGAIRRLGPINQNAVEEYAAVSERYTMDLKQRDDIVKAQESLEEIIAQLTKQMEAQFIEGFKQISESFDNVFRKLFGGGRGILKLSEDNDSGVLECGIDIIAQPPGKKLQNMLLLSGGERALTAIALLFAIQQLNPAPFCVLDEIEAALDDANVARYAGYLNELCDKTQFIVITHRKGTMSAANTLYGVTMEEKGISKCLSIHFRENDEMEWLKNGTA